MHYYPEETAGTAAGTIKVVIFTCNWNGYSGLETAGKTRRPYPATVFPVRVECLGRLHPGMILKAFEKGAAGVLLVGCASDECYFDFGSEKAEAVFGLTRELLSVLGYSDNRFKRVFVSAGQGEAFVHQVHEFIEGLTC